MKPAGLAAELEPVGVCRGFGVLWLEDGGATTALRLCFRRLEARACRPDEDLDQTETNEQMSRGHMKLIARLRAAMGRRDEVAEETSSSPADPGAMQELRARALALKADEIGLSRESFPEVWGILMESGFDGGAFSLVVLGDGTASVYTTTGAGIIGAGQDAGVRDACTVLLTAANRFVSAAARADNYPLPAEGQVIFYFLAYHGVLSYSAKEDDLAEERDALSYLFHTGHLVITRMREIGLVEG